MKGWGRVLGVFSLSEDSPWQNHHLKSCLLSHTEMMQVSEKKKSRYCIFPAWSLQRNKFLQWAACQNNFIPNNLADWKFFLCRSKIIVVCVPLCFSEVDGVSHVSFAILVTIGLTDPNFKYLASVNKRVSLICDRYILVKRSVPEGFQRYGVSSGWDGCKESFS